jgi:hypothetical protein
MELLPDLGKDSAERYVIRPSKAGTSADKYTPYRCASAGKLVERIISICESVVNKEEL